MPPKITVIVPNFNHAQYLGERLDSIFAQTYEDYEVFLLDDASNDSSTEVLKRYACHPKVSKLIINEQNSGSTFHQWNKGIATATGKYIWVAESDDRAAPEFLSTLIESLERNPETALAYSQSRRIDHEGKIIGSWLDWTESLAPGLFATDFNMQGSAFTEQLLLHRNVIPNASAVVFRRNAYIACAGADPEIRYCGDWFVWLKLALQGTVSFHAAPLNDFRQHDKSVIASRLANHKDSFLKKYDIYLRQRLERYLAQQPDTPRSLHNLNSTLMRREAEREARLLIKRGRIAEADAYIKLAKHGASLPDQFRLTLKTAAAKLKVRLRSLPPN